MAGVAPGPPQIVEAIVWRPDSPPAVQARYRGEGGAGMPQPVFRAWLWNISNLQEVRLKGAVPQMQVSTGGPCRALSSLCVGFRDFVCRF